MRRRLGFWRLSLMRGGTLAFGVVAAAGVLVGITAVAILTFVTGFSLLWSLLIGLLIALAIYGEGSYRLWDEADMKANPDFPRHRVSFGNPMYVALDPDREPLGDVLMFDLSLTNREDAPVSILVELFWERAVQGQVVGPYSCSAREGPIGRLEFLRRPLDVGPRRTVSGQVAFSVPPIVKEGHSGDVLVSKDFRFFVRLTDYVSDAQVDHPLFVRALWTEEAETRR